MTRRKKRSAKLNAPAANFAAERKNFTGWIKNDRLYDQILFGLVLAHFLFYFFRLFSFLDTTLFWADENAHAYIASVILKSRHIPVVLPNDIYGGFVLAYPPFFHVIGAVVMAVGGFGALQFTNLALLVFFVIVFYGLIRRHFGSTEALIACILMSSSPTTAINSIRFTTEMLSMVLVFCSFFFWVTALKNSSRSDAVVSGLATGLLLLSKQLGIVVLGFYFFLLVWFYLKHKADFRLMLCTLGTSLSIFLPYFVWTIHKKIEVFDFFSVFLGNKAEWAIEAVRLFQKYDSGVEEFVHLFYQGNGILLSIAFLFPVFWFIRSRGKERPINYVFLMSIYLAVVMVIWHITNARHTIVLLPLMTFLIGYSIPRIIPHKAGPRLVAATMLLIAGYYVYHMPNYRNRSNAPGEFVELAEVLKKDNTSNQRTLTVNTFETLMYSGKPVIWPFPNLRRIPIDLFETQPADDFFDLLRKYRIGYIMVNLRHVFQSDQFLGRNYPLPFLRNCEALTENGKLSVQKVSSSKQWLLLKVLKSPSPP